MGLNGENDPEGDSLLPRYPRNHFRMRLVSENKREPRVMPLVSVAELVEQVVHLRSNCGFVA